MLRLSRFVTLAAALSILMTPLMAKAGDVTPGIQSIVDITSATSTPEATLTPVLTQVVATATPVINAPLPTTGSSPWMLTLLFLIPALMIIWYVRSTGTQE